ncbi:uracil-xanthine permease family protein [Streptomyces eurythermus]|uniref:uracil-xanthine permease family protein n=1 Tax=Streptomyces eurythermus TaxID=42237 RepID=UPI0033D966C4
MILLVARFGRGFLAQTGVLLGLLAGTAVAVPLGLADFSAARAADWIGLSAPFHFGAPEFPAVAVLSMCVVMLVLFAESTADLIAVAELTGRRLTTADMARGLAKLGAWVAGLPQPVVGAAGLVMSATVAADGVSTLREVDFDGTHNLLIVAVLIGVGMAPEMAPDLYSRVPEGIGIVLGSPVTSATLLAFCLNLAFNGGIHDVTPDSCGRLRRKGSARHRQGGREFDDRPWSFPSAPFSSCAGGKWPVAGQWPADRDDETARRRCGRGWGPGCRPRPARCPCGTACAAGA